MAIQPQNFFKELEFALGPIADVQNAVKVYSSLTPGPRLNYGATPGALEYGKFMVLMARTPITQEMFAKAHMITLSSIQRGELDVGLLTNACVSPEMADSLGAVGITPDCFTQKFFVNTMGFMSPRITKKGVTVNAIRPEDYTARFLRIHPFADQLIKELIQMVDPARRVAEIEWKKVRNTPEFVKSMTVNKDILAAISKLPGGLEDVQAVINTLSPQSKAFLGMYARGFRPFGKVDTELIPSFVTYVPRALVYFDMLQDLIKKGKPGHLIALYKDFSGQKILKGVATAKVGFIIAMLGRGDLPVVDARELDLFFPDTRDLIQGKPAYGLAAIPKLALRLGQLPIALPTEMEPFRIYLAHHVAWDAFLGQDTLHADMAQAILGDTFSLSGLRFNR